LLACLETTNQLFMVAIPVIPKQVLKLNNLGGGFKYVLFSPLPGEMIQFDKYFSNGLKPPTSNLLSTCQERSLF